MKIQIIQPKENKKIQFSIPLGFIFNRFTCSLITSYANKYTNGIKISSNQMIQLMKCLKESKKDFGHYDLVNIETNDGEIVIIRI